MQRGSIGIDGGSIGEEGQRAEGRGQRAEGRCSHSIAPHSFPSLRYMFQAAGTLALTLINNLFLVVIKNVVNFAVSNSKNNPFRQLQQ